MSNKLKIRLKIFSYDAGMLSMIMVFLSIFSVPAFSQYSVDYYIAKAVDNSPTLKEYQNQRSINRLQNELNRAQNSAFQVSLTSDYLFVPYLNNRGNLVTTNPSSEAIGYDINLSDGGLYSAKINLQRNIINGKLMGALEKQIQIQDDNYQYSFSLEKHNLEKQVIDQYLNALQLLRLTQLAKEIVANLQDQLDWNSGLVEKGEVKAQDYLLLKIEFKNQSLQLDDTYQQYKRCLCQLNALCGIRDTFIVTIDPVSLDAGGPKPHSDFLQKFILDSLNTVNEQKLFETKYGPMVNLFFNTGLEAVELHNIQRKFGMSAGLNMSLSLYDGRQKQLTRQQNLINQKIISEFRHYSERTIETQRRNFKSRIQSMLNNIDSFDEQIEDYEKLIEISSRQLQQGNISMIDYLALFRNYFDLKKNKIDMETNCQLEKNNYNYWNW